MARRKDRHRAQAVPLVLDYYRTAATVSLRSDLLPGGGTTEYWAASAGHPDLSEELSRLCR